jgi:6-pyruvoyltetrahydropterin/6-carboxytetrahydropterin synthase
MRIEIDGWQARITFSAAHVIAGHPKCGRLHGHTYAVHAILHGDLGPDEMVFDFGVVKRALRALADELDHKLIAPSRAVKPAASGTVEVVAGEKSYRLPRTDVAAVEIEASSAERLAQYFADRLLAAVSFPPSLHQVEVGVDEGPGQGAWVQRRLPSQAERGSRPRRR